MRNPSSGSTGDRMPCPVSVAARVGGVRDATMTVRLFRAACLALALAAAPAAFAKDAAPAEAAPAAKAPSAGQSAARERQKTCGAEWRALTDAQKTAQGPKWPQFWSKCNKRLKGNGKA